MTKPNAKTKSIFRNISYLAGILAILLVTGCSDGGGEDLVPPNFVPQPNPVPSPEPDPEPDPEPNPDPEPEARILRGGAVDGPIANAAVSLYRLDPSVASLQGELLDQGATDSQAKFTGLEVDSDEVGPFLLVVTADEDTIDLNTGEMPVILQVRTVIRGDRVSEPVYATPLTTMAVAISAAKRRDGGGTTQEFTDGLTASASELVSALGFGMKDDVDIFSAPPMVTDDTDTDEKLAQVAQYRTAIAGTAAVIFEIQQNSGSASTDDILNGLADDLTDGAIDGKNERDESIETYNSDEAVIIVEKDPSSLTIPGTDKSVQQVESLLSEETADTGTTANVTGLDDGSIQSDAQPAEVNIDRDGDGVNNSRDAFPNDPNENVDTDGDGVGNNADPDDDNDGVADIHDAFPLDRTESLDTDGDGIGNNADPDDDGDGVADADDDFPLDAGASDATDVDGDGWPADQDSDDNNADVPGSEFVDTDGDGIGNVTDPDDDNDGVPDEQDAFPLDANESSDTDGDGIGDRADDDIDGDGVPNHNNGDELNTPESRVLIGGDAFPFDPSESSDLDGDGIGDNADSDADGDGLIDTQDPDPTLWDTDGDGVRDGRDAFPEDASETKDSDQDGVGDNADNCKLVANSDQLDTDGNGQGNACDLDDDGDGISDADELAAGTDPIKADTDEDGVRDDVDNCPLIANADQADGDENGTGDACDTLVSVDGFYLMNIAVSSVDLVDDSVSLAGGLCTENVGDTTAQTALAVADGNDFELFFADEDFNVEAGQGNFTVQGNVTLTDSNQSIHSNGQIETRQLSFIGTHDENGVISGELTEAVELSEGESTLASCTTVSAVVFTPMSETDAHVMLTDEGGFITTYGQSTYRDARYSEWQFEYEVLSGDQPQRFIWRSEEQSWSPYEEREALLFLTAAGWQPKAEQVTIVAGAEGGARLEERALDGSLVDAYAITSYGVSAAGQPMAHLVNANWTETGALDSSATLSANAQALAIQAHSTLDVYEVYCPQNDWAQTGLDCANFVQVPSENGDGSVTFANTFDDVIHSMDRAIQDRFDGIAVGGSWDFQPLVYLQTSAQELTEGTTGIGTFYIAMGMDEPMEVVDENGDPLTVTWEIADPLNNDTDLVVEVPLPRFFQNDFDMWFENTLMLAVVPDTASGVDVLRAGNKWAAGRVHNEAGLNVEAMTQVLNSFDYQPTAPDGANLVRNGGFEAVDGEFQGWYGQEHNDANATFSVTGEDSRSGSQSLSVNVTNVADELWSIQAGPQAIDVIPGERYTFIAWVKASRDGAQVVMTPTKVTMPFTDFGRVEITTGTEWHRVVSEIHVPDDNPGQLRLVFNFSTPGNEETTFYVDDVQLWGPAPEASELQGENVVINGDLEMHDTEYTHWVGPLTEGVGEISVTSEDVHNGVHALRFDVISVGDDAGVSTGIAGLNVVPGTRYTAVAWVKGTVGAAVDMVVNSQDPDRGGMMGFSGEVRLTSEWQEVRFPVDIIDDSDHQVTFSISANYPENAGAVIYIDDLQLWGERAEPQPEVYPIDLNNAGFEQNSELDGSWVTVGEGATFAVATEDAYEGVQSLRVDIVDPGTESYHTQTSPAAFYLEPGRAYRAQVAVKGPAGSVVEFTAAENESWMWLNGSGHQETTGDWQILELDFQVPTHGTGQTQLAVNFGFPENINTTFHIDAMELVDTGSVDVVQYMNGGLESNPEHHDDWSVSGEDSTAQVVATEPHSGSYALELAVGEIFTNPWDVQAMMRDVVVVPGNTYEFVGWIKGTEGATVQLLTSMMDEPWETYGASGELVTDGQWQRVSFGVDVPADGAEHLMLHLHAGYVGNAGALFYVDGFSLWGVEPDRDAAGTELHNPGFELSDTADGWNLAGEGASFTVVAEEVFEGSQALRVDVVEPGTESYLTQASASIIQLTPGREYQAKVQIHGAENSVVSLMAVEDQSWTFLNGADAVLTGGWQEVVLNFYVPTYGSGLTQLSVNFGFAENANASFYVDAMEVASTEILDVTQYMNAGFEYNPNHHDGWSVWGATEGTGFQVVDNDTHSGSHALHMVVGAVPENSWEVQAKLDDVQVVTGNNYEFIGWVKGTEGATAQILAGSNGEPWDTYGGSGDITFTGDWQRISFGVDVPLEGFEYLMLSLDAGNAGNEGAEFYVDDFSLWGPEPEYTPRSLEEGL